MFEDIIRQLNDYLKEKEIPTEPEKRVYTVKEIREILQLGRNSTYKLIGENHFHSIKIGNRYRISKKSFDKWMDEQNRGAANE